MAIGMSGKSPTKGHTARAGRLTHTCTSSLPTLSKQRNFFIRGKEDVVLIIQYVNTRCL